MNYFIEKVLRHFLNTGIAFSEIDKKAMICTIRI